jgi:hypothetical protein
MLSYGHISCTNLFSGPLDVKYTETHRRYMVYYRNSCLDETNTE